MQIRAVRTLCFSQPMIPIHARTFPGQLELLLTGVEADDGTQGYSLARAHGGQSARVIGNQIDITLQPLVLGCDPLAPVPICTTRLPIRSTLWSQRAE